MGRQAIMLIGNGTTETVVLGVAILVLPFLGAYVGFTTLRAGFQHSRLSQLIAADGLELDTSGLPRRPSGRFEREAADAFFLTVKADLDQHPDDWRHWYRVARAYDIAGDRRRAREAMSRAVELEREKRRQNVNE
ncbi:hypothetical protein ONR57_11240 [Hoyosella sp. YIM 151337]|uniref:hypothetical protein n=1 Tax=Hoyosella sp. YIM 151337 TaxID=2992742 RepID=UPI002236AEF9|nr:hypothetical protein [Hoyosella sp. YIM 151337]MCW4353872.1 hypothetical protein [Hoyosella sp. YIM 151337]